MFKLAGSVILFGVFSAFVVALIKTILDSMGGILMLQGAQSWIFENKPAILSTGVVGGPFEKEGRLTNDFDQFHEIYGWAKTLMKKRNGYFLRMQFK